MVCRLAAAVTQTLEYSGFNREDWIRWFKEEMIGACLFLGFPCRERKSAGIMVSGA